MTSYRITLTAGDVTRDFIIVGGPIDNPEGAEPLFQALGRLAASWSRLEQHIDALLMQLNDPRHSLNLYSPDHPVSFQQKIKLLKRWFNQHPALENFTDDIRTITSRLKVMGQDRNVFLHSNLEAWDAETETAHMTSIKYEGDDNFRIIRLEFTLESIAAFTETVNLGNEYLASITTNIFTREALDALSRPRKFGWRTRRLIRRLLRRYGGSK